MQLSKYLLSQIPKMWVPFGTYFWIREMHLDRKHAYRFLEISDVDLDLNPFIFVPEDLDPG